MKTNKSYSKRLKITPRGKLLARKAGQDHFNAKEARHSQLAKKRTSTYKMSNKNISRYLPGLVK